MGLISCANFVIAGVDGVIHQRDFTSVKINANITFITVLVDVTYSTNQSWFVANILENKYNLFFLLIFFTMGDNTPSWGKQSSKRTQSPRGNSGNWWGMWELWKGNYKSVKKFFTLPILFLKYRCCGTFIENPECFNSIEEHHFVVPKGKYNLTSW